MRKRRLVLSEESSDGEMEAVTLNRTSAAEEEFQWAWKREAFQAKNMNIALPFFSRRDIVDDIAKELKLIGEGVYQEFLNSCFGSLMHFDTQGSSCKPALRLLLAHEVVKADASPDELWFRVGGRFIRFSKYEYALVTGLSFGPATFDPSAEHHPPASGLFLRYYQGQMLKMDVLRLDFTGGVFRESPADALKVAKLLIVYFLLFGRDGSKKFIDEWAWTLIEDSDGCETFIWGKYTYQILLTYLQGVPTKLSYLQSVHTMLSRRRVSSYLVCGYVWAFLIWAFEAIPELGNNCGVHISDDGLPRGIRWRFPKTQVDVQGFRDRQMEVRSTLEPSAEEQRQKYWEHIHDELQSSVCYVHPVKKKTSINPSSHDVLPVFTKRSCSMAKEFKKKWKRTDPSTTQKKANKKLCEHECGSRDEMTPDLQKKLSALVRGELPVLVRQELPSVIHLALRDFFLQRDHAVGGTSPSMKVARPTDENLSLSLDSEPELSDVAVDQAGQNKLLFELNEKINELKNKNLENERLVGVFQEKYKHLDTMVVEMDKEIEKLRHEKSAAIRTVKKLRLKQLEADKVVEELKRKNLEAKESNNDKADIRLGNLSQKIMKIEATSEEGEILDRNFKGEKYSSGNGSRISRLSKKGDRNSAQLWTREDDDDDDDDAHAVKTSRGSQSRDNPPQSECNVTIKDNEHREPQASDTKCEGNSTAELNGLSDEASTDYSDESCTDSRMDNLIVSLWSKNHSRKWTYEADMLRAFQQDEQLCMNAVCALYRQHIVARKSNVHPKTGGFGPVDSVSGCALAEYLTDGDEELRLRKSVSEVKNERPDVIGQCRKLATIYVEKLFEMYCTADDPFNGQ